MYKIITDISIITEINTKASLKENDVNVKYCDIQKHPLRNEWLIPIIPEILVNYNLLNYNELITGTIEAIPEDWFWVFMERPIRVSIPYKLQAKAQISKAKKDKVKASLTDLEMLGELLNIMLPLIPEYMIVNVGEDIIIYLEELYPEHRSILELFEDIKIEGK